MCAYEKYFHDDCDIQIISLFLQCIAQSVWIYAKHFSRLRPVSFGRRHDPSSKFSDKIVAHRIDQIRRTIGLDHFIGCETKSDDCSSKQFQRAHFIWCNYIMFGCDSRRQSRFFRCKRTHHSCMVCVNVPLFHAIGSMHLRKMCVWQQKTKQIIKIRFKYWHVRTSQIV